MSRTWLVLAVLLLAGCPPFIWPNDHFGDSGEGDVVPDDTQITEDRCWGEDGAYDCSDPACQDTPEYDDHCKECWGEDGYRCSDPACQDSFEYDEHCIEDCYREGDQDGDGLSDCEDPDCADVVHEIGCPETDCTNGIDDDGDELVDCADPDCDGTEACLTETDCADDIDDDGDTLYDCADPDCMDDPVCHIGEWLPGFERPGVIVGSDGSPVQARLWSSSAGPYVVGWYAEAGGRAASSVARWDGQRFEPVVFPSVIENIGQIAVALETADGGLLVGGDLYAPSSAYNFLGYRSPAGAWSDVGGGIDGWPVTAAEGPGNSLFVGGSFSTAGGVSASNIARWDGSAWHALGFGVNGVVQDMVVLGTDLYVSGQFSQAGGRSVPGVARWNTIDAVWESVGDSGIEGDFAGLATDGSRIVAAGAFTQIGTTANPALDIASYDPVQDTWAPAATSGPASLGNLNDVAVDDQGDVWAIGEWYDGSQYHSVGVYRVRGTAAEVMHCGLAPDSSAMSILPDGTGGVYLSGGLIDGSLGVESENPSYNGVLHIPTFGGDCEPLGRGIQGFTHDDPSTAVEALQVQGDLLHVGGLFWVAGAERSEYLATWDALAGEWIHAAEAPNSTVRAFSHDGGDGPLYVGGAFTAIGDHSIARLAAWSGTAWSPVGGGVTGGDVRALAQAADGTLYVGGSFGTVGSTPASGIAAWDGVSWSDMAGGVGLSGDQGTVHALAVLPGGRIAVGGEFATAGGDTVNNLAIYDPERATWEPVTDLGPDGPVYALHLSGDLLYVGGEFTAAGGVTADNVAAYDLITGVWSAVGDGFDGRVEGFAEYEGVLVAAGAFEHSGAFPVPHVARLEGDTWWAVAGGTDGIAHDVVFQGPTPLQGPTLYTGGRFDAAGDEPALNLGAFLLDP